jgi:hypothetical protein
MTDSVFMLNRFPQVSRMQVTVHKPHAPIAAAPAGRLRIEKLRAAKGEVGEFAPHFL